MKQITLIIALFFLSQKIIAQQIEGFGFLKIGRNESEIIDSLTKAGLKTYKCISINHENTFYVKKPLLLKFEHPKKELFNKAPLVNGHTKYRLVGITIGAIKIPQIELHFLDSKLIAILIDANLENTISFPDIKTALLAKYGNPEEVLIKKYEVTCYSATTGNFKTDAYLKHFYFRNDEKFSSYLLNSVNYDRNCRLNQVESLVFETESYKRLIVEEDRLNILQSGKKINLNDF